MNACLIISISSQAMKYFLHFFVHTLFDVVQVNGCCLLHQRIQLKQHDTVEITAPAPLMKVYKLYHILEIVHRLDNKLVKAREKLSHSIFGEVRLIG